MTKDRESELRRDLQATVTAYRARLAGPPTKENLRIAEEIEDTLYYAGLALQSLGLKQSSVSSGLDRAVGARHNGGP